MKEKPIVSLGHIDISASVPDKWDFDSNALPVLPTRDFVMFPDVTFPIVLGRSSSLALAERAEKQQLSIGVFCQTDSKIEKPRIPEDIYKVGVLAHVIKVFELPDGNHTAILHSGPRIVVSGEGSLPGTVSVDFMPDTVDDHLEPELNVTAEMVKETALALFRKVEGAPQELSMNIENVDAPTAIINMVCTHTPFPAEIKGQLLSAANPVMRGQLLLKHLKEQEQLVSIREDITERTRMRTREWGSFSSKCKPYVKSSMATRTMTSHASSSALMRLPSPTMYVRYLIAKSRNWADTILSRQTIQYNTLTSISSFRSHGM